MEKDHLRWVILKKEGRKGRNPSPLYNKKQTHPSPIKTDNFKHRIEKTSKGNPKELQKERKATEEKGSSDNRELHMWHQGAGWWYTRWDHKQQQTCRTSARPWSRSPTHAAWWSCLNYRLISNVSPHPSVGWRLPRAAASPLVSKRRRILAFLRVKHIQASAASESLNADGDACRNLLLKGSFWRPDFSDGSRLQITRASFALIGFPLRSHGAFLYKLRWINRWCKKTFTREKKTSIQWL